MLTNEKKPVESVVMKNGIVTLNIFEMLDSIAHDYKIKDGQWATASGMKYASRVAEMRWRAKVEKQGGDIRKIGRAFTVPKLAAMIKGLQILIGEEIMNKEMLKRSKEATTRLERVLYKILAVSQNDLDLELLEKNCDNIIWASTVREKKTPKSVK